MRTVGNMLTLGERVWVQTRGHNLQRLFLQKAEEEGFTLRDGGRPTEANVITDIFVLHNDWTIGCTGWAGHMAFYHPKSVIGDPIIRVDYGKYLAGRDDYQMD